MKRAAFLLLLLVGTVAITSCDCDPGPDPSCGGGLGPTDLGASNTCSDTHACNAMEVVGGLGLNLGTLDDGTYSLVGSADGEPFACNLEVSGDRLAAACTQGAEGLTVEESLPRTLRFLGAPCLVTLTVSRDGAALLSGSLRPDWNFDEPNGFGCGWVAGASANLDDFDH